jgi:heat shock protein HtpX
MGNTIKTALLLSVLGVIMLFIGNAFGGRQGMMIALVIAIGVNFFSYWFSDKLALMTYRAQKVSPEEAPELHSIVDDLSRRAGLPKPGVYIIPTETPNAFATGRNPSHASVAVTQGILRILNRDELTGVLAHELAHVSNRDILISSIAATLATAITFMAHMARMAAFFGGMSRDRDDNGNVIGALALAIVAPIAAMLVQLAVSRSREYQADRSGALISGKPEGLASALMKLHHAADVVPMEATPSTAHMFIVNPLRGGLSSLFSTHPPMEERVSRLNKMAASDEFKYRIG